MRNPAEGKKQTVPDKYRRIRDQWKWAGTSWAAIHYGLGGLQINANKNLRLIGPLPPEFQSYIVYAAAPMNDAASPAVAKAFIAFLVSPAAKALLSANGVE